MRPMTIEDFLKYVNVEAHYASGIFRFCEYSVDFITDKGSEDRSFHVHITFSRYGIESEVDVQIDFVCGEVLLFESALKEIQNAIRDACAHLLVISYRKENILDDRKKCFLPSCIELEAMKKYGDTERDNWIDRAGCAAFGGEIEREAKDGRDVV